VRQLPVFFSQGGNDFFINDEELFLSAAGKTWIPSDEWQHSEPTTHASALLLGHSKAAITPGRLPALTPPPNGFTLRYLRSDIPSPIQKSDVNHD
jgi:hypothetical protein